MKKMEIVLIEESIHASTAACTGCCYNSWLQDSGICHSFTAPDIKEFNKKQVVSQSYVMYIMLHEIPNH